MHYINLDGVINEAEWATAQYKTEFWLNVDKNHINGNNYLYIGEDEENLYIALDLCSDNTSDDTGEWLGLGLNTDNSIFSNQATWEEYIDNGVEFLMHDVENGVNWPFFDKSKAPTIVSSGNSVNNMSEINVVNGTLSGDLSDLDTYNDATYMQLNSSLNITNHITQLDFEINVSKYFLSGIIEQLKLENIDEIRIALYSRTNITITSNKIVFWYSNGTYNLNDPDQVVNIHSGGLGWDYLYFGGEDLTADRIMKFSIFGNHSSAFTHDLDNLGFLIYSHHVNTPITSNIIPYSSINNYEIKWSFGPSSNNATDHRMFEIVIPKSELQNYETAEDLGIIIGGYGTLAFPDMGYWVYSKTSITFDFEMSNKYYYYNMNMKPFNPPENFTLSSDSGSLDLDGSFNLNWIPSVGADNYSIYTHNSFITGINENITLLDKGLTNYSISIAGLSQGEYYYLAVAYNETGYYESNCLKISVIYPPSTFTLSSDADSPDIDGIFNLNWTASEWADNYSIYMHTSSITIINTSLTIIAEGLTDLSKPISISTGGDYYFVAVAFNEVSSQLSNNVKIKVILPCGAFVLNSDADNPDIDGTFNLTWSVSTEADNYSVYMYNSEITAINASLITIIEGNIDLTINITGVSNGIYYFIVVAHNEISSQLSNYISVVVGLEGSTPFVSGYEPYLIIAVISVISLILIIKKKRPHSKKY